MTTKTLQVNRLPKRTTVKDSTDNTRSVSVSVMGEDHALVSVDTAARQYLVGIDRHGARDLLNGLVDFLEYRRVDQ